MWVRFGGFGSLKFQTISGRSSDFEALPGLFVKFSSPPTVARFRSPRVRSSIIGFKLVIQ